MEIQAIDEHQSLSEPWEAEAMALSIALQEAGYFTAREWSAALGSKPNPAKAGGETDDDTSFSELLLAALEGLACDKGLVDREALRERRRDWENAYRTTPHGKPVRLEKPEEQS